MAARPGLVPAEAPVDRDIAALLQELVAATANVPPLRELQIDDARELARTECLATAGAGDPLVTVQDLHVPVEERRILVRVYRPAQGSPPSTAPVVVFVHGGGFCLGGLDTHDGICRDLVAAGDFVCVAVDYRLAPEHPYPAGLDDCIACIRWVRRHLTDLAPGASGVVVGGDSAGAGLAAAACLSLRDSREPLPLGQVLVYPVLDLTMMSASATAYGSEYGLSSDDLVWYYEQYLGGLSDPSDPRASPLLEADLSGLPPAVVVTVGYDPLRDEGQEYAARLTDAGVPTSLMHHPSLIHGALQFAAVVPASRSFLTDIARAFAAVGVLDEGAGP
jgi:acetyl esterase